MEKLSNSSKLVIILIIFLIIVIGIWYYLPSNQDTSASPQITEREVGPLETKKCEIDLYPDNEITLKINQTYKLTAYHYQGSMMDVSWTSKYPNIASFKEHLGNEVTLIAYNKGRTEVIVNDRTMGEDCTDYLFVNVE